VNELGRRTWKRDSGYHRQARVENAFFRYETIVAPRLRARDRRAQEVEALLASNILNRMRGFARPESYPIGVWAPPPWGTAGELRSVHQRPEPSSIELPTSCARLYRAGVVTKGTVSSPSNSKGGRGNAKRACVVPSGS